MRSEDQQNLGRTEAYFRDVFVFAKQNLTILWQLFIGLGGFIFIVYSGSIEYIPELSWESLLILLAVVALLGIYLTFASMFTLIVPGLIWAGSINSGYLDALFSKSEDPKAYAIQVIRLFMLPFFIFWLLIPAVPYILGNVLISRFLLALLTSLFLITVRIVILWCLYSKLPFFEYFSFMPRCSVIIALVLNYFISFIIGIAPLSYVHTLFLKSEMDVDHILRYELGGTVDCHGLYPPRTPWV